MSPRTGSAGTHREPDTGKKTQRKPKSCDRRQDYSDSEDEHYYGISDRYKSPEPVRRRMPSRAETPPLTPPRHERSDTYDERARSRNSSAYYPLTPPSTAPKAKTSKDDYRRATTTTRGASDSEEEEYIPTKSRTRLLNLAHSLPSPRITPPRELEPYCESPTTYETNIPIPNPQFVPTQSYDPSSRFCSGWTQKNAPCQNRVKVAGSRCYRHRNQVLGSTYTHSTETQLSRSTDDTKCGGPTVKGPPCKNRGQAAHGGGCHLHPRGSNGAFLRSDPAQSPESTSKSKCGGPTKAGTACKNAAQAKHGGGCHLHPRESDGVPTGSSTTRSPESTSNSKCGGPTKAGTACKNAAQERHGGGCHLHPRKPSGISSVSEQRVPRPVEETLSGSTGKPRCTAPTKSTGRRCKNRVTGLGSSYCSAHRAQEIPRPTIQTDSSPIKLSFSDWIPTHLQPGTQEELRNQLRKPLSKNDQAGYIYAFERREHKRKGLRSPPQDFVIKVGRSTKSVSSRQREWQKCFEPKELVVHGWWPNNLGEAGSDLTESRSLRFGTSREDGAEETKGKYCYRVERLVLLELEDVARNSVHLQPKFLRKVTKGIAEGRMGSSVRRPSPAPKPPEEICHNCRSKSGNGVRHQEIFKLKRMVDHEMAGKEWEFVVRPIIEKWGRFMDKFGDKLDLIHWEGI